MNKVSGAGEPTTNRRRPKQRKNLTFVCGELTFDKLTKLMVG